MYTMSAEPPLVALPYASFNFFFFSINSRVMFPKDKLLHFWSFSWHSSKFLSTAVIGQGALPTLPHAAAIVLWHLVSQNQTCSNVYGFCLRTKIQDVWVMIGLWLDISHSKWTTFVAGKSEIHSLLAIALSRRSQTVIPLASFFPHVNLLPTNPKSVKTQSSKISRKSCIHFTSLILPPSFSWDFRISLKSLAHNHGSDVVWLIFLGATRIYGDYYAF